MKIFKYIFRHKIALLLVLCLFVGQAFCELSLPNYTSDIVDVGIQQGGVEDVATTDLSARTHDFVLIALNAQDEALFQESYMWDDAKGHYVLNEKGFTNRDTLNNMMALPMSSMQMLDKQNDPKMNIDTVLRAYKAGLISKDALREKMDEAKSKMGDLGDSIISQQGISAARAEYQVLGMDTNALQMDYLVDAGLKMLLLTALAMLASVLVGFLAARTGAKIGRRLREQLFKRVVAFSSKEVDKFGAASLITRGTNDVQLIQMASILFIRMVLYAPVLAVGGIIMVAQHTLALWWIIALSVVAVFILIAVLFAVTGPKFKAMQKLIDRVNLVAREILTGIPVIRAFGRENYEKKRFDAANVALTKTQLFTGRAMAFMIPVMTLVMNAVSVLIIWVGAHFVDTGNVQTGDLIALITYSMLIIMSFLIIGVVAIILPRANVACERHDEVVNCEPSIEDPVVGDSGENIDNVGLKIIPEFTPDENRTLVCEKITPDENWTSVQDLPPNLHLTKTGHFTPDENRTGVSVEFKDVSFSYDADSKNVLEHVDFIAEAGKTTAIIGATGSGKSTIIRLIERFRDVDSGNVFVDGIDVRDYSQKKLRALLGYVPQKAFLFSGTIESNVCFSGHENPKKRDAAIQIAEATEIVNEKEAGLNAPISEGGTNVSGGQRQRLAIARAINTDAKCYLFDDSFSALDYKTDALVRNNLSKNLAGRTSIIVAQRIATVMDADRIVVLDQGKIVGKGSHRNLLYTCQTYRDIALSQLSSMELFGSDEVPVLRNSCNFDENDEKQEFTPEFTPGENRTASDLHLTKTGHLTSARFTPGENRTLRETPKGGDEHGEK